MRHEDSTSFNFGRKPNEHRLSFLWCGTGARLRNYED